MPPMRVVVVSEFYPRASDPVLGVWAHRQALASSQAGAEVQVLVLHRPIAPRAALARGAGAFARETARLLRQPHRQILDGLPVTYVPFLSPPRERTYAAWGAWAAPSLALALRRLRRGFPFELVHAHNAVPGGDAVRRARLGVPLVVSVHGADVLYTAPRLPGGERAVGRTLGAARLVLANSQGIERLAREDGARETRVVHLGADLPDVAGWSAADRTADRPSAPPSSPPGRLITVGHLVARKRHADVIRALARLADRHPAASYVVVGDGPERGPLEGLAAELGVSERVTFLGPVEPDRVRDELARADLFVMPSVDEAFGVAYIEAMGAVVPAIGCRGEPGPEEIARTGEGMVLVAPRDPEALARTISDLLGHPHTLADLGHRARATVERAFTWAACGSATVAAYRQALSR